MLSLLLNIIPRAHAGKMLDLPNYTKFTTWQGLLGAIIEYMLTFAGMLAVVAIVYSGIMYITAGGDTSKAGAARKNLIWAITGIILIMVSLIIVNEVQNIFAGKY